MFKLFVLTLSLLLQVLTSHCFCNDNLPNWPRAVQPSPPCFGVQQPGANLPIYPQNQYAMDVTSLSAFSNCRFPVTSSSPIAPGGVSIRSENVFEGPVSVRGQLPFLSAVAFEGSTPSFGSGGVAYGCGNGNVKIFSEFINEAYQTPGAAVPSGRPGLVYGFGSGFGQTCY